MSAIKERDCWSGRWDTHKLDSPPSSNSESLALVFASVCDSFGQGEAEQVALERERKVAHRVGRLGMAEVVQRILRSENEGMRETGERRSVPEGVK